MVAGLLVRLLVRLLAEAADQVLEDVPHLDVRDRVGVQVDLTELASTMYKRLWCSRAWICSLMPKYSRNCRACREKLSLEGADWTVSDTWRGSHLRRADVVV